VDDPTVLALAKTVGGSSITDLGGTMSLNLHLAAVGLVLRVHQPFVTRRRVLALRQILRGLVENGLGVPEPVPFQHRELVRCRGRWAELETFKPNSRAPATWHSYIRMFRAMGTLHRALAQFGVGVPTPVLSTYGPPGTLRRWMVVTTAAVGTDTPAGETAAWVNRLIRELDRQWVPSRDLPCQLIHGDIRLSNVVAAPDGEAVYLDFGFAAVRPRIHDLAYSLAWIVLRPDGTGTGDNFGWERLPELIDAYEEGAGVSLESIERQALGPYLAAVPLYLAAISGYTPGPARHLLEELPFLRIAEWALANLETVTRREMG